MKEGKHKRHYEEERQQVLFGMQFSYCCSFHITRLVVDEFHCTNDLAE
jgi:hypothetical protein